MAKKLSKIAKTSIALGALSGMSLLDAHAVQNLNYNNLGNSAHLRANLLQSNAPQNGESLYLGHVEGHQDAAEGKCGEGKCGEGKCGDEAEKKEAEGSCGAKKEAEGSCGANKAKSAPADAAQGEGHSQKSGTEGSCGSH